MLLWAMQLASNTTGNKNTAVGSNAMFNNTSGEFNTATGYYALVNNTTGNDNSAFGTEALATNTTVITIQHLDHFHLPKIT